MRESFLQWKVSGTIDWNIYIYIKLVGEMNPGTLDLIQVCVYVHAQLRTPWLFTSAGCCAQCSRRDRSNDQ